MIGPIEHEAREQRFARILTEEANKLMKAAASTPATGGANISSSSESGPSLATNKPEVATVAPPKPDETPVAAGADESWKRTPHTHRIPRASFPPFTSESAVDREDDSDEFAFPRSRRIVCSASSDGQFTIHRFGDPGITLTAAEARTVFEFLEDAQPIFERICK